MDAVINLKNCRMTFKRKELIAIIPIEPTEGAQYTEQVCDYEEEDDLDRIYKIIWHDEY